MSTAVCLRPFGFMCALLLSLVLGGCVSTPTAMGPQPGEVLVTFALPGAAPEPAGGSRRAYHGGGDGWQVPLYTRQQVHRFARDHGLKQTGAWPIDVLGVYCVAFALANAAAATPMETLLPRLDADPRSRLVQLNATFAGMSVTNAATDKPIYDDPLLDVQYGRFVDRLSALHAVTGGDAVRVGVIDTSVDLTHPDLSGQVARQIELVPAAEPAARLHGTAVTGVIAAAPGNGEGLVGMAPRANVHVYGACTDDAEGALCTSFSIAQALGDALAERMQVINMSFAGPDDPLIAALLDAALAADTVLVAAGNRDAPDARFPAGHPGVHAADGARQLWFASAERLSTRAGGSYQMFFGSSIASAGMSGMAALLRARTSAADTSAVLDWLFEGNCDPATQPVRLDPIRREQLCD
ncbi:MAG: S8 family serine peptidase [Pseudomonadales bacterium]